MPGHSLREQIVQAVLAAVGPAARDLGAGVHRSPTTALSREQCPALAVFAESDVIAQRANDRLTRELTLRLVALARSVPPTAAETEADRLLVAAHAALMRDPNLGGLALAIREMDCEWDVEEADAVVAAIPGRYRITYRTLVHDLSLQG